VTHREFAIDLAQKAGVIMRENFLLGMKKEWKEDGSPLTVTDKRINEMFVFAVQENYPEYGIIAEEGGSTRGSEEYVWVCDPIDGTMPFSHGIPTFVFAIALVRDGKVILGVVYDPVLDRLFVGELGQGATMNGEPITVSPNAHLQNSQVNCESLTWWTEIGLSHEIITQEFIKKNVYPLRHATSIYSGMLVAAGELSASLTGSKFVWDCASVKIIIEEAGGKATDINGQDQRYDRPLNGFIVTNGKIHDEVIGILQKARMHVSR